MSGALDLARTPAIATWELDRASDHRCLHCRQPGPCAPHERPGLSPPEAMDVVGQLEELAPVRLVLATDDPLAHVDVIAAAVGCGLRVAVAPRVVARGLVESIPRLAQLGVRGLVVPFDGTGDAVWSVAACARRAGLALRLVTRLDAHAAGVLPFTAERVAEIGPRLWTVSFVVPRGDPHEEALGAVSCERVFHFLYEWSRRTRQEVDTEWAPAYRRVWLEREVARHSRRMPDHPLPLNDGKGLVFVSYTGEIHPSAALPLSAGNVRDTRLATAYRTSRLFRALRAEWRLEGRCGVCRHRALCGGSRARAYAATGDFLAEDPACAYHPPVRPEVGIPAR